MMQRKNIWLNNKKMFHSGGMNLRMRAGNDDVARFTTWLLWVCRESIKWLKSAQRQLGGDFS